MTTPRSVFAAWGKPVFLPRLACIGLLTLASVFPAFAQTPSPAAPPPADGIPDKNASTPKNHKVVPVPIEAAPAVIDDSADKGELRGMWVVRDSLTSPASIRQVVSTAVKYHLNALFVQVRGRGDALYNSPYEPRAEALARQPASFDPLALVVSEAHAHGIQVHAWMNTFLTWSGSRLPSSPLHLWRAHREWFACDRNGHCSPLGNDKCEGAFLSPSDPEAQNHIFNVFTYVAKNYDVDGIHFDYCRYAGSDYDFSAATLSRFREYMDYQISQDEAKRLDGRLAADKLAYVHAFGAQWADWRRRKVTGLVRRISEAVKEEKPWMQVSAAVFADGEDAFRYRGQDWQGWLKAGYLDAVALMSYAKNTSRVLEQTRKAVAIAGGQHVYTGIGAWRLSAHDVAEKIAEVRRTGAAGVNLFSYGGVHQRPKYLDTLAQSVFAHVASLPRMAWLPSRGGSVKRSTETAETTTTKTRKQ